MFYCPECHSTDLLRCSPPESKLVHYYCVDCGTVSDIGMLAYLNIERSEEPPPRLDGSNASSIKVWKR